MNNEAPRRYWMPKHREQWNYLEELIKSLEPSNLHDIMMRLGEVAGTPPKVSSLARS